jgi:hypothetical protein
MKLTKLIPKLFYADIQVGLNLFVNALGFKVTYSEPETKNPFYLVERDNVRIQLVEDEEYARKDRPEIRIETDDIETLYQEIKAKELNLFHPNLPYIKTQPWGLKEFALLDETTVCVIIQQDLSL